MIRAMLNVDIEKICELETLLNVSAWKASEFERSLNNERHICLIFEINGQVSGYCILSTILDESELLIIGVAPDKQGQGIASKLLRNAIENLKDKGCIELFLEVRSSNILAIKLYEKFKFERIGLRKAYYGNEDAVLYKLTV